MFLILLLDAGDKPPDAANHIAPSFNVKKN